MAISIKPKSFAAPLPAAPQPPPKPAPASASLPQDTFSAATSRPAVALNTPASLIPTQTAAGLGAPPATNLLTENRRDGLANCLDQTGDYLSLLPPQQQARAEAVFLRDTRPGLEGQSGHVLIRQGDQFYDPTTRTSYSSLAAFDPQGNYQVAGTVNGRELVRILDTAPGSPERQAAIARANVPASLTSMMVADTPDARLAEVTRLNAAAATAESQLTELDQQLSRELARFGPAMTPEQRDQFIAGFKSQHPEYQAALAAQQALGDFVQANFDQLRAEALSNPAAADALAQSMASLAGSPRNALVIQALNDGELTASLVQAASRKGIDFAERIHAPALGTFATEGFLQAGTDAAAQQDVVDQLKSMLDIHSRIPGLADSVNVARQAVDGLAKAVDGFAVSRNFRQFAADLGEMNDGIRSPTPIGRAIAGAGFALGAMMIAEGVAGQDGDRLMQGLIQSAQNANALGYGAELLSRVAPQLISKAAAEGAVELTRKFAGVVAVVTNGLDLWNQLHDLDSNSDAMNAYSKLASTVGSICMLVPGGQLPGIILSIVGAGLGLVAGAMESYENQARDDRFDQEALNILQGLRPPLDAGVVSVLQGMSPETIARTQQTLNLTPAEWTRLADERPELVSALQQQGPHLMDQLGGAFGLHSLADVDRFMAELAPPGQPNDLPRFFTQLAGLSATSPRELQAQLQWEMQNLSTSSGQYQAEWGGIAPDQRQAPRADPYNALLGRANTWLIREGG